MSRKFVKNYVLKAKINLETGLHIGGLKETVEIGGTDNPVITTYKKINGRYETIAYIPGSSLKGKIRSLLDIAYSSEILTKEEWESKRRPPEYIQVGLNYIKYDSEKGREIIKVFGVPAEKIENEGAGRLVVRDAFPTPETVEKWKNLPDVVNGSEVKAENTVNRITSAAMPRFFERVPADSEFECEMVLSIYEEDSDALLNLLLEGMKMLEDSYLGGFGSRGYGKIKFKDIIIKERPLEYYEGNKKAERIYAEGGTLDELIEKVKGNS